MLLERIVPEGGATFDGVFLPGGTIVGMNPWVVARDKKVYGEDAVEFRPERRIEACKEDLKLMERNFLAVSCFFFHWLRLRPCRVGLVWSVGFLDTIDHFICLKVPSSGEFFSAISRDS